MLIRENFNFGVRGDAMISYLLTYTTLNNIFGDRWLKYGKNEVYTKLGILYIS